VEEEERSRVRKGDSGTGVGYLQGADKTAEQQWRQELRDYN